MKSLGVQHQDKITSLAYDFYGLRMATCSVDHTIKVFDKVENNWQLNDSWRAHEAPVIKVSWAGPKHAPLLASASHDCTVKLWEEIAEEPYLSGKRWKRRYTISDYKGPLYDIQFCPNSQSLKLAGIASDGVLRIHEAIDTSNIGYWTAVVELPLLNRPVSRQLQSSFSLSWSPMPSFQDWIAVSVLDDAFIFCCEGKTSKYMKVADLPGHSGLIRDVAWAPSFGRSAGLIATACKDGNVRIFSIKKHQDASLSSEQSEKIGGASMVGKANNNADRIVKGNQGHLAVEGNTEVFNSNDLIEISPRRQPPVQGFQPHDDQNAHNANLPSSEAKVEINIIHESADHQGEVWRVTWNPAGTILASTGDDAKVRFWKSMGPYKCMAVLDGYSQHLNE